MCSLSLSVPVSVSVCLCLSSSLSHTFFHTHILSLSLSLSLALSLRSCHARSHALPPAPSLSLSQCHVLSHTHTLPPCGLYPLPLSGVFLPSICGMHPLSLSVCVAHLRHFVISVSGRVIWLWSSVCAFDGLTLPAIGQLYSFFYPSVSVTGLLAGYARVHGGIWHLARRNVAGPVA